MYKIKRIYLENFKLFDNATINFDGGNLIVLDGPNGFGKTTIFDAIELAISGKISRVDNNSVTDGRTNFGDILYCKDNNKDAVIKVEFESESCKEIFTLVRKIFCQQVVDKNSCNWAMFKAYKFDSFDISNSQFNEEAEISQEEINNIFSDDMSRIYKLYYYIQQEDNTYFLKKSESDRVKELSHLFDTKSEEEKKLHTENTRKRVKKLSDDLRDRIKEKEDAIKVVGGDTNNKSENEKVEYSSLLDWMTEKTEWDKADLNINEKSIKDKYKAEIRDIEKFVRYFQLFQQAKKNREFARKSNDLSLIKSTIQLYGFIDEYEKIKETFEKQNILNQAKLELEKRDVASIGKNINFELIADKVDLQLNLVDIRNGIERIAEFNQNSSEISKVVKELNDTRVMLLEKHKIFSEKNQADQGKCPLCGHDWNTLLNLEKEIEVKEKLFNAFYDDTTTKVKGEENYLHSNYFNRIRDKINEYLKQPENLVDSAFYSEVSVAYKRKAHIEAFVKWCEEKDIDFRKFLNRNYNEAAKDINIKVELFSKEIQGKCIEISDENYINVEKEINFENIFDELFDGVEENVCKVTSERIKEKLKYIDYLYFNQSTEKLKLMKDELSELREKKRKLDSILKSIKAIKDVYDTRIKEHWSNILKKIEIPFYIYSGKIIQDYQRGLGVFVKEATELKNIKFVPSGKTDHDAINSLSSGQLSGLVIAFTLALNKVYGDSKFKTILIDDPVQTMDDINMASLVEILRNEFSDKQLIISTHEDDISMYIRYKFYKYGINTVKFNVKNELSNAL